MSEAAGLEAKLRGRVGALLVDVDLRTGPGTLVLVGPNGAGKTSLLSMILGVARVEEARVSVAGLRLHDTSAGIALPLERRRLGYVPQRDALFPHFDVRGNVDFALASARPELARRERAERVSHMLAKLGLTALAHRWPRTLSGGERQRVALARALSIEPRALLLDEPLASLDVNTRGEVREFLAAHLAEAALPTLLVTHDAADARALAGRVAVLERGVVTQEGSYAELEAEPRTEFVAGLTSARR